MMQNRNVNVKQLSGMKVKKVSPIPMQRNGRGGPVNGVHRQDRVIKAFTNLHISLNHCAFKHACDIRNSAKSGQLF
jgi:hypothetical protein